MPEKPADFKVKVPVQVRFRDTDAMGHVNNAVYHSYLEYARMKYFEQVTGLRDYRRADFILARVELDYRSPVVVGEELEVGVRCSALRRTSFELAYRVVEKGSGRLVAEGRTVQACYDYARGRVKRLDEEQRRAIAEFENDPELFHAFGPIERGLEEGGEG
jgi:acyl-CoA thioester hydrolase